MPIIDRLKLTRVNRIIPYDKAYFIEIDRIVRDQV